MSEVPWRVVGKVRARFLRDGGVVLKNHNYEQDFLIFRKGDWDEFVADVKAGKFDRSAEEESA